MYLIALVFIAITTLALGSAAQVWQVTQQREREQQLLFVGSQFRDAIGAYFESTPGGAKRYPPQFDDLLKDPRYLSTRRYLRRVYTDPITGKADWGLVRAPDGGIAGVYSLSEKRPLKTSGFDANDAAFEDKTSYVEWKFVYSPAGPAGPARQTGGSPNARTDAEVESEPQPEAELPDSANATGR